jgi:hypothetical protein
MEAAAAGVPQAVEMAELAAFLAITNMLGVLAELEGQLRALAEQMALREPLVLMAAAAAAVAARMVF